ncbi:unnamed protein product [Prorocentrum cordatum]|uniref:Hexosyltransferase n=1 Tax=Prorocentrum cordatum TaxID=2364126 RepID=A0ABN9YDL3_9DINO|nr:unnamed protein product [Polarella glacialis]
MPRGPLDPLDPPEGACPPRAFCGAAELEAPLSGTCEWAGCSGSRRVRWWRRAWKLHAAAGAVAALLSAALALAIWRSAGLQSAQSRAPEAPTMASKAAEDLPGLQATGPKAIDAPGLSLAGRAAGLERVVAATTATSTTTRAVSLFCFSVMVSGEWERELVTFQLQASAGIFACDRTVVFSDGPSLALGRDAEGNDAATWPLRPTSEAPDSRGLAPSSRTASRLSATALARAFDELIGDELGAMWAYDWLVKADLDTVFFPDRLRLHLADHGRGARYLLGCTPRLPARARLHGALAAFSAPAMEACGQRCVHCHGARKWRRTGGARRGVAWSSGSLAARRARCRGRPGRGTRSCSSAWSCSGWRACRISPSWRTRSASPPRAPTTGGLRSTPTGTSRAGSAAGTGPTRQDSSTGLACSVLRGRGVRDLAAVVRCSSGSTSSR